jgi:hypothetical protein
MSAARSENPMLMYRNVDLNAFSLKVNDCTLHFPAFSLSHLITWSMLANAWMWYQICIVICKVTGHRGRQSGNTFGGEYYYTSE